MNFPRSIAPAPQHRPDRTGQRQIKRRAEAVGISPSDDAIIRLEQSCSNKTMSEPSSGLDT